MGFMLEWIGSIAFFVGSCFYAGAALGGWIVDDQESEAWYTEVTYLYLGGAVSFMVNSIVNMVDFWLSRAKSRACATASDLSLFIAILLFGIGSTLYFISNILYIVHGYESDYSALTTKFDVIAALIFTMDALFYMHGTVCNLTTVRRPDLVGLQRFVAEAPWTLFGDIGFLIASNCYVASASSLYVNYNAEDGTDSFDVFSQAWDSCGAFLFLVDSLLYLLGTYVSTRPQVRTSELRENFVA